MFSRLYLTIHSTSGIFYSAYNLSQDECLHCPIKDSKDTEESFFHFDRKFFYLHKALKCGNMPGGLSQHWNMKAHNDNN